MRARGGLHLAEHHGVEAGADRIVGIAVATLDERVARSLGLSFRPRLNGGPRLRVEEHARVVAADAPFPFRRFRSDAKHCTSSKTDN